MDWKIPDVRDFLANQPSLDDPIHYTIDPMLEVRGNNHTNMATWYPLVCDLNYVPFTLLVPVPYRNYLKVLDMLEKQKDLEAKEFFEQYVQPANGIMGYDGSVFVRSYFHSAKHEITQTQCTDLDTVWMNVCDIIYATALKDLPFEGLAYREYVELEAPFTAFSGLPIAKERRVFVERKDNDIVATFTAYWPKKAIHFGPEVQPSLIWEQQLAEINELHDDEIAIIEQQALEVYDKLKDLHENWSLDFAKGVDGKWYFIDAAVAEASWRPDHDDF